MILWMWSSWTNRGWSYCSFKYLMASSQLSDVQVNPCMTNLAGPSLRASGKYMNFSVLFNPVLNGCWRQIAPKNYSNLEFSVKCGSSDFRQLYSAQSISLLAVDAVLMFLSRHLMAARYVPQTKLFPSQLLFLLGSHSHQSTACHVLFPAGWYDDLKGFQVNTRKPVRHAFNSPGVAWLYMPRPTNYCVRSQTSIRSRMQCFEISFEAITCQL